jgi:hypothetical protein
LRYLVLRQLRHVAAARRDLVAAEMSEPPQNCGSRTSRSVMVGSFCCRVCSGFAFFLRFSETGLHPSEGDGPPLVRSRMGRFQRVGYEADASSLAAYHCRQQIA